MYKTVLVLPGFLNSIQPPETPLISSFATIFIVKLADEVFVLIVSGEIFIEINSGESMSDIEDTKIESLP